MELQRLQCPLCIEGALEHLLCLPVCQRGKSHVIICQWGTEHNHHFQICSGTLSSTGLETEEATSYYEWRRGWCWVLFCCIWVKRLLKMAMEEI